MLKELSKILLKEYDHDILLDCTWNTVSDSEWLHQDLAAKAILSGSGVAATKLSCGLSNNAIAEQRRTSGRTIGTHLKDIYRSMDNADQMMFTALQVLYGATQNGR